MTPASYIRYTVLPQLEAYSDSGVPRVHAAFNGISAEAEDYSRRMYDSYLAVPGSQTGFDLADLAEEARDHGADYYVMLESLRQAMINLLAAGLYHLYEQHRKKFEHLLTQRGMVVPDFCSVPTWEKVEELRLLANAIKHADGPSAKQLRQRRPDLFLHPSDRGTAMEELYGKHGRAIEHPLGGADLYVGPEDLCDYREAVRELWTCIEPLV